MRHDENVRPCSICNDPDGLNFEDEMFLCDECRKAYEPVAPVSELASINDRLDAVGIPRNYPGSGTPCTTRERVAILVNLCLLKGVTWNGELEEVY